MSTNTLALGKMGMTTDRTDQPPQRATARMAGVLYLIIIVAGIFAQFFVRQSLVAPGDAAATGANIAAAESLFRMGIAADLVMILSDVALALVFYVLLRSVSQPLALMAAFFRLAQAATLGINLLNLFFAWQFQSGAEYLSVFSADQLNAFTLFFMEAHAFGYSLAMAFFGVNLLILGYLIFKSGYFPRILGILAIVAAVGYLLADSFAKVLLSNYASYAAVLDNAVIVPAFIAELALCLWLLVKGVKTEGSALNHG